MMRLREDICWADTLALFGARQTPLSIDCLTRPTVPEDLFLRPRFTEKEIFDCYRGPEGEGNDAT